MVLLLRHTDADFVDVEATLGIQLVNCILVDGLLFEHCLILINSGGLNVNW